MVSVRDGEIDVSRRAGRNPSIFGFRGVEDLKVAEKDEAQIAYAKLKS